MEYPTTRSEAKQTNASYYFTGKPCKHGHIALRKTKGLCIECMKVDWKKQIEKRKTQPKSEAAKASGRKYYLKNKEKVKASAKKQPIEKRREYRKRWKQNNPISKQASDNAWKRRQKNATPSWLSVKYRKEILEIYKAARRLSDATNDQYVVDHIVPLKGEIVCGLHVPWNLQILKNEENARKSNSHEH